MTYIPSQFGASGIASNALAFSKLAQAATRTLLGNSTGSTANLAGLTATQATALLNAVVGDSGSGGTQGLVPAPGSGDAAAGKFLKADATWATAGGGTVLNTFTPVVKFGGAHVGMTFSDQHGSYVALGNIVIGCFNLDWTAKGSSTGNATLTMPAFVGAFPLVGGGIVLDSDAFASLPTDTPILIFINGSDDAAITIPFTGGTGQRLQLTHANFTNSTIMRGIFCYLTDTF